MPAPQELSALPYAGFLDPFTGALEPDGEYTEIHLADARHENVEAGNARLTESAITGMTFEVVASRGPGSATCG